MIRSEPPISTSVRPSKYLTRASSGPKSDRVAEPVPAEQPLDLVWKEPAEERLAHLGGDPDKSSGDLRGDALEGGPRLVVGEHHPAASSAVHDGVERGADGIQRKKLYRAEPREHRRLAEIESGRPQALSHSLDFEINRRMDKADREVNTDGGQPFAFPRLGGRVIDLKHPEAVQQISPTVGERIQPRAQDHVLGNPVVDRPLHDVLGKTSSHTHPPGESQQKRWRHLSPQPLT